MEWALSVCNATQFSQLASQEESFQPPEEDGFPEDIDFTRLYFGQEFCERALPNIDEVMRAVMFCNRYNRKFTLVTPYVTEYGLCKLGDVFASLERYRVGCEVVVNDWGVLNLLRGGFPSLLPVLGRLLNKTWRDPRMDSHLHGIPKEDLGLFRTCSLAGPFMRDLMERFGVDRIEMDNLLQGLDPNLLQWGYLVSLYLPYGLITTGRICFFQSWGLKPEDKFRASPRSCARQCEGHWLAWRETGLLAGPGNPKCRVMQKGNSVFYRQSPEWVKKGMESAASLGVSRIVYQPEPL